MADQLAALEKLVIDLASSMQQQQTVSGLRDTDEWQAMNDDGEEGDGRPPPQLTRGPSRGVGGVVPIALLHLQRYPEVFGISLGQT